MLPLLGSLIPQLTLSGLPRNRDALAPQDWKCGEPPTPAVENRTWTDPITGLDHVLEILRHLPLVAAVRGFGTEDEIAELDHLTRQWAADEQSNWRSQCMRKDCGCWFDVVPDHDNNASSFARQNFRITALLHALSSDVVDYSRARRADTIRLQLYNSFGQSGLDFARSDGGWCAPHSDFPCEGQPVQDGDVVAIAMLSYRVAERGGETTLSRGSVIYKPELPGDLILFGNKQSTDSHDLELSEHAGCPVWQGQKWITTARMKEGSYEWSKETWLEAKDYYVAPFLTTLKSKLNHFPRQGRADL